MPNDALPNIPKEMNGVFMQRLVRIVKRLGGLNEKNQQAVTRQDLIKLGLTTQEEVNKL